MALILLVIAYLPTLNWMINRWSAPESYYGHGFLIPFVSLFLIWRKIKFLKAAKISTEMSGLTVVIIGLLMHIVCAALKIYFISGFSFVIVLYGLVLFCFGKEATRMVLFPS